jgi:hypothetical protein
MTAHDDGVATGSAAHDPASLPRVAAAPAASPPVPLAAASAPPLCVGDRATTVTAMRPAGRVRVSATGRALDVCSDRGWIDAGCEVVFVRREEGRLVVRPAAEYAAGQGVPGAGTVLLTPDEQQARLGRPHAEAGRAPSAAGASAESRRPSRHWDVAAGAGAGVVMLLLDGREAAPLAAGAVITLTCAWGWGMGGLRARIHREHLPSLRAALAWWFALLGFAAAAVLCLGWLGAPKAAAVAVAGSLIGACVPVILESFGAGGWAGD